MAESDKTAGIVDDGTLKKVETDERLFLSAGKSEEESLMGNVSWDLLKEEVQGTLLNRYK